MHQRDFLFAIFCVVLLFHIGNVLSLGLGDQCGPCRCVNELYVDCSHRNLSYIPTLPGNTTIVDFSSNSLQTLSRSVLANITDLPLKNISFRHCNIHVIMPDAFLSFPTLEYLDISENYITWRMLQVGLVGLADSNLKFLNISSLNFGVHSIDIPKELFASLIEVPLTNLSMRNNGIKKPIGVFGFLRNLTFLDLSNNKIYFMDFLGLHKVQMLNLTMNEFDRFQNFCGKLNNKSLVPALDTLHMGMNSITYPYKLNKIGHCLPNLRHLNLTYNPIRVVMGNSFSTLPSLETLSLANLLAFEVEFETTAFNASKLRSLHIGNVLRKWPASMNSSAIFKYCPNLEELDLTWFKLTYFKREDFRQMLQPLSQSLKRLVLDSSSMQDVPPIDNLYNLEVLILRKNYIQTVDKHSFVNNTKLRRLSLSINQISNLNENSFPPSFLENVEEIDLAYNPFSCTCELVWFLHWMKSHSHKVQRFPKYYYCDSPTKLKRVSLMNYDPSYEECHPVSSYIVMAIVLAVVTATVFIVAMVIRRYRWDIKYYIYLVRSRKGYQRIPEEGGFFYDAFVAYNASDRAWVMSQLVALLEKKHRYKLCLHERDFLPGELIVDQITEKAKASRRFILVISNNFAKSQWCQYEIFLAQNRLMEDGADILIPVLLEDIKGKYMSTNLKFLLKSLTYLEWTNHTVGRQLFFNKLELAMKK